GAVCFRLAVDVELPDPSGAPTPAAWENLTGIEIVPDSAPPALAAIQAAPSRPSLPDPPVVVGAGPAGLLAAWRLAEDGLQPILVERGAPVQERHRTVARFWSQGVLDGEDNVLFGEGGAGLYSDGKLTTQSKLRGPMRTVLELLVQCGADASILIDAEPHLGTDRLRQIVPNLRELILAKGGQVRFHSCLEGLELDSGQLTALIVNGQRIATRHCLLATGQSARDVYPMLHLAGVALTPKPFAVGVRIEAPQRQIDQSQFGPSAGHRCLGAASFRLTRRPQGRARACYSFCMCPGGLVIACASSPGMLTTNGMSLSHRASGYGNAAFLVPIEAGDFGGSAAEPLAGIAWQGEIEAKTFQAGGSDFSLPACTLGDFLARRTPQSVPPERPPLRAVAADLHAALPDCVSQTLLEAVPPMMRQMRKVAVERCMVYGAETRSSSPVRIPRDDSFQSPSARGVYPVGEGAGYAGGIVTSAIDGLRAAESLLAGREG
ncbi:MAG TPA: FAD-binding protein, partial [Phycisphaerae bacterium]|nr:FAD-binding protein [Phycisphaerae bacterium]